VAEGIEHAVREGAFAPNAPLPSHRELCRLHGVSLKTVRKALDLLENRGVLYRRERSGTFVLPATLRPRAAAPGAGLACINVIEPPQPASRAPLRTDYLKGYTDALDRVTLDIRFKPWTEGERSYDALLAPDLAPSRQACLLVNIAPAGLMASLRARGVPFVVQYFRYYPDEGLPPHHSVYVNKVRAGYDATRHLQDLGHRRIGYAGLRAPDSDSPGLYDGYRAALQCAGTDHAPEDILDFSTDDVAEAMSPVREFLSRTRRPTALFARTDALAMATLAVAPEFGLRVPQDLSVVGFNDLPESALTAPPLTTMASPRRALARTAIDLLLNVVARGDGEYERRMLNCHLVIRGSTAPARRAELVSVGSGIG
jgi:hypothetical protein